MREIKFRAWDIHDKEMQIIDDLYWFEEQMVHSMSEGLTGYKFMQYIDLKDKNGVKIWEGDICKYVYHVTHGPHEEGVGEVFWDQESAGFLVDREGKWTIPELASVVVVGNIYEGV